MHLIYFGDSQDESLYVASALTIPSDSWASAYNTVRRFRKELKDHHGIPLYQHLTPGKFISGRGRPAQKTLSKGQRYAIFKQTLQLMVELPEARLVNVVLPIYQAPTIPPSSLSNLLQQLLSLSQTEELQVAQGDIELLVEIFQHKAAELQGILQAFQQELRENQDVQTYIYQTLVRGFPQHTKRLAFNLLQKSLNQLLASWNSYGILILSHHVDPGIKKQARLHYEVSSEQRLIEDQFIKDPQQSYFLQLASFAAYALLRKERPIPTQSKYGLDKVFDILGPLLAREVKGQGILRLQHIWESLW